jgi:hypothetical protein
MLKFTNCAYFNAFLYQIPTIKELTNEKGGLQ